MSKDRDAKGRFTAKRPKGGPKDQEKVARPAEAERPARVRKPWQSEKVLARRRQVSAYLARGLHLQEIASLTGMSLRTTYEDIQAIHRQWAKQTDFTDARKAITTLLIRSEERLRHAWALYYKDNNGSVKASMLKTLQEEDKTVINLLQSLGAMPKELGNLEVSDWRTQLRAAAARRKERQTHSDAGD